MIHLSNVLRSGYITARDQSMLESGVTEGVKNTTSFFFALMNTTTQTRSLSKLKSNDFQSYPRGESAASCHLFSGFEN